MIFGPRRAVTPPTEYLWYDFSDVSSLWQDTGGTVAVALNADPIGRCNDKSGNGFHLVQATAGARPTYRTNVKNGLSVGRFDGVDDFLKTTGTPAWIDGAIFVVAKVNGNGALVFHGPNAAASGHWLLNPTTASRVAFGSNSDIVGPLAGFFDTSLYGVYAQTYDSAAATKHTVRRDGAVYGSTASGAGALVPAQFFSLCQALSANFMSADICEVRIYSSALSDAQISYVETLLKSKWGTA